MSDTNTVAQTEQTEQAEQVVEQVTKVDELQTPEAQYAALQAYVVALEAQIRVVQDVLSTVDRGVFRFLSRETRNSIVRAVNVSARNSESASRLAQRALRKMRRINVPDVVADMYFLMKFDAAGIAIDQFMAERANHAQEDESEPDASVVEDTAQVDTSAE